MLTEGQVVPLSGVKTLRSVRGEWIAAQMVNGVAICPPQGFRYPEHYLLDIGNDS
jgi:hypothetical protein